VVPETPATAAHILAWRLAQPSPREKPGGGFVLARRTIQERRAERELLFWTIEKALKNIALAAFTVYSVVSLIQGQMPGAELLSRVLG
jgi:hypothetical protein